MKNYFDFKMLVIRSKLISPIKFRTKYFFIMLSQAMFTHFKNVYIFIKIILNFSLFIIADLVN